MLHYICNSIHNLLSEVVEAMIQNYRLKLQILEDLLVYLQESTKTIDDEKDEFDI